MIVTIMIGLRIGKQIVFLLFDVAKVAQNQVII